MTDDVRKKEHLVVAVSPELVENPEELLNPKTKVFLNDVFDPIEKSFKQQEIDRLLLDINASMKLLRNEYKKVQIVSDVELRKLDDRYNDIQERKLKNRSKYPEGKLDFNFLKSNS